MKLNNVKNNNGFIEFSVEMDSKEWKDRQDVVIKKLGKNIKISGYRPGKAPVEILRKNINEARVLTDAAQQSIDHMLEWLVDNNEFLSKMNELLDNSPKTNIQSVSSDRIEVQFNFPTWPKVDVKYKDIKLETKKNEISDKDVEEEIKKTLAKDEMVVPKEGTIESGDIAVINFKGFVDDVPFEGGESKNYELKIGSKSFIDNFEDQLIGLKAGDKKDVNVTFPKNYHAPNLAGKKAKFEVDILVVNTIELPKLDDEYVKNLKIENVKNVNEFKKHIKANLLEKNEKKYESDLENELVSKLIEDSKVEPATPQYLIDRVYSTRLSYFFKQFGAKSVDEFQKIISNFGMNLTDFEKNQKNEISRLWKFSTILREIAKLEKVQFTDEETKEKIDAYAKQWECTVEEVKDDPLIMNAIHIELNKEKAFKLVRELYIK